MPQVRSQYDQGVNELNAVKEDNNTRSREEYLKVILLLSMNTECIRSSDVADKLGVTRASVSNMMNVLKENGCIEKEKYSTLTLTEYGRELAMKIKNRYDIIKSFLVEVLEIDVETAEYEACNIEHVIGLETLEKLNERLNNLSNSNKKENNDSNKIIGGIRYA